jgi:radical SAM protein with 4Fe4S-binding SPASM domain
MLLLKRIRAYLKYSTQLMEKISKLQESKLKFASGRCRTCSKLSICRGVRPPSLS